MRRRGADADADADAEGAALWARVKATVRPMIGGGVATPLPRLPVRFGITVAPVAPAFKPGATPGDTLDGGWDKRLTRGVVQPDRTIDLHGHTLRTAHAVLDRMLGESIARGDRVILLVTGKPPRAESERPHARGAIRAAVPDWIGASRHANAIAAVRGAHPRHGGAGALYIVLRRPRGDAPRGGAL